jgi:para-aminobenzoate synthetase/4-amino-4-deoxychorismate lyase
METNFLLLETMRVSADGTVYLLDRHLERLQNSARYFSFKCDLPRVRRTVIDAIEHHEKPARMRLLLPVDGECDLEFEPLSARPLPRYLRLSRLKIDSTDPFLYHKTTNRRIYDEARRGVETEADIILVNGRGEVTETTRANLAVLRDGLWVTPPVSCGLLPGVMRGELLRTKQIVEEVIRRDQLIPGETIRCFNSVWSEGVPLLEQEGWLRP